MSYIWGPSGDTMRGDVRKVRRRHTHHPVTLNPACQGDLKQRHTYRACVRVMDGGPRQTVKFHCRKPLQQTKKKGGRGCTVCTHKRVPASTSGPPDSLPCTELCKCQRLQRGQWGPPCTTTQLSFKADC